MKRRGAEMKAKMENEAAAKRRRLNSAAAVQKPSTSAVAAASTSVVAAASTSAVAAASAKHAETSEQTFRRMLDERSAKLRNMSLPRKDSTLHSTIDKKIDKKWSHGTIKPGGRSSAVPKKKKDEPKNARSDDARVELPAEPAFDRMDVAELRRRGLFEFPEGKLSGKTAMPHQKRLLEKLADRRCLLAWHPCGSGKTLGALLCARAALETGIVDHVVVIVMPVIEQQWRDVARDFGIPDDKMTITTLKKGLLLYNSADYTPPHKKVFVIFDESQRGKTLIRTSADGKQQGVFSMAAINAGRDKTTRRLLYLSATPVVNTPKDLCNVAGAFRGLDPALSGVVYKRASDAIAYLAESKLVDYHELSEEDKRTACVPEVQRQVVDLVMDAEFAAFYDQHIEPECAKELAKVSSSEADDAEDVLAAEDAVDPEAVKVLAAPGPKKRNRKSNAFDNVGRRYGNVSVKVGLSDPQQNIRDAPWSPKQDYLFDWLMNKRMPGEKFVVSTSWAVHGAGVIAVVLEKAGFDSYMIITGKTPQRERAKIVKAFNAGNIECIIFTDAGREGMDLIGCTVVFLFDPCWTDTKVEQAIGRAARSHALDHLPPGLRIVRVYELVLRKKERTAELKRKLVEDDDVAKEILDDLSADESLIRRCSEKRRMVEAVMGELRLLS